MKRIGWRAVARYLAGESSKEERADIRTWTEADAHHAEMLETSQRAWDAAEPQSDWNVDAAWRNVAQRMQNPIVVPIDYARRKRSRWWLIPAAAAAIILLVVGPFIYWPFDRVNQETTIATGPGQQRTIRLVDGSVARLAENSSLRINRKLPREVYLHGRAFFAVAERNVPFVVRLYGAGEARVLGTRFELYAERMDIRLAVLEGRVELIAQQGQQVVDAGHVIESKSGAVSLPRATDVQQLIKWMGRVLIFQDTPLQQAVQEIERLYGINAEITDNSLNERTVTATFENETFSTVITTLCRVVDAKCDVQDKAVSISQ